MVEVGKSLVKPVRPICVRSTSQTQRDISELVVRSAKRDLKIKVVTLLVLTKRAQGKYNLPDTLPEYILESL
jgi:hypothetical protein